jgi:hypothetical protein
MMMTFRLPRPWEPIVPGVGGCAAPRLPAAPTRRRTPRRLRLIGLVIAAILAGSAGTHWVDSQIRTDSPRWTAACQEAINANARLHRQQAAELAQGMGAVWSLIAGAGIPNPTSIDRNLDARLQRDADNAISRCVSPATPDH